MIYCFTVVELEDASLLAVPLATLVIDSFGGSHSTLVVVLVFVMIEGQNVTFQSHIKCKVHSN